MPSTPSGSDSRPPFVSVIVPAKDRESLVSLAVRSALSQAGCRVEVIVVDDRSADGTRDAVLAIGDSRVRLVAGEGRGPAAARNAGLRAASASESAWVAFLDSDDLFEPGKLARQSALLAANPSAGLCYTGHAFFGPAARREGEGEPPPRKRGLDRSLPDGLPRLLLRPYFLTSSVVVRKELIARVGLFDEALPFAEDYDFYLRCAAAAPIVGCPEPLVRIRRHDGNLTSTDRLRLAYLMKRVVRRHLSRARGGGAAPLPARLASRRLAHLDYAIGALLLERGGAARARGHFLRAIRRRPLWVKAWKGTLFSFLGK